MRLIERRIGFLFAVFLTLLALGVVRVGWLGVVKAGTLKQAAVTQQEADLAVPARRGTIIDRDGTELAVSQPAVTIALPRQPIAAGRRALSIRGSRRNGC